MGERFIPFSNGSEYDYWRFHNCERCTKDYDYETSTTHCDLEQAILIEGSDQGLSIEHQARIGIVETPYKHLGKCKEFEPTPSSERKT